MANQTVICPMVIFVNIIGSKGPILRFPSITKHEEGDYICTAENDVGRTVGLMNAIEVNRYKPTMRYESVPIHTITEYKMNDENSVTTTMQVLVQGFPHPIVTWWKEGENGKRKITGESSSITHGFIIRSERDYSCYADTIEYADNSLEIYGFKKSDVGTYVAIGESSLGKVELKFIIRLDTD